MERATENYMPPLQPMQLMSSAPARILLGLGASRPGEWGTPRETVTRCLKVLPRLGFRVHLISGLYVTEAVGPGREGRYVNAVATGESHMPPHALLRLFKTLERQAGGRSAMRWGPRALDIDILDYRGLTVRSRSLQLPHRQMADRPFVLVPLAEIAPGWRHPKIGLTARQLLRRLPGQAAGQVLHRIPAGNVE